MATIGLDSLYYAAITEGETGDETYGTPLELAKAIKADMSVELAEAILYAGDVAAEVVKEFKSGKLSLEVNDIGAASAAALLGATVDENGVLISTTEDVSAPVAIAFRAKKSSGDYVYYWLYRVVFGIPSDSLQTKGDTINFSTPKIEGTITRRNKKDDSGKNPWRAKVDESETGADATTITNWFSTVYEPVYDKTPPGNG